MQVDQMLQYHLASEGAVFDTGADWVELDCVQNIDKQLSNSVKTTVVVCGICMEDSFLAKA